jgi:hypothetical protein
MSIGLVLSSSPKVVEMIFLEDEVEDEDEDEEDNDEESSSEQSGQTQSSLCLVDRVASSEIQQAEQDEHCRCGARNNFSSFFSTTFAAPASVCFPSLFSFLSFLSFLSFFS